MNLLLLCPHVCLLTSHSSPAAVPERSHCFLHAPPILCQDMIASCSHFSFAVPLNRWYLFFFYFSIFHHKNNVAPFQGHIFSWFSQFTFTLHVGLDCHLFPHLFHGSDCSPCLQLACIMHCIFTLNMEAACWSKMTWCHISQDCNLELSVFSCKQGRWSWQYQEIACAG